MRLKIFVWGIVTGAGASWIIGTTLWAAGPKGGKRPTADVTKLSVEQPVAALVKNASVPLEQPVAIKHMDFRNPRVKPGEVCWHFTFAEACQASGRTHKPVLLFQLLGKLDQEFC